MARVGLEARAALVTLLTATVAAPVAMEGRAAKAALPEPGVPPDRAGPAAPAVQPAMEAPVAMTQTSTEQQAMVLSPAPAGKAVTAALAALLDKAAPAVKAAPAATVAREALQRTISGTVAMVLPEGLGALVETAVPGWWPLGAVMEARAASGAMAAMATGQTVIGLRAVTEAPGVQTAMERLGPPVGRR